MSSTTTIDSLPINQLEQSNSIPSWLDPLPSNPMGQALFNDVQSMSLVPTLRTAPLTMKELKEARETNYAILFERYLPHIEEGRTLRSLLRDTRENEPYVDIEGFRRWVMTDKARKERYYEAKMIAADCIEDELIEIADAEGSMEDVQRSKLKVDTRREIMGVNNKARYSKDKEVGGGLFGPVVINIGSYVPQVEQGLTIEGERE